MCMEWRAWRSMVSAAPAVAAANAPPPPRTSGPHPKTFAYDLVGIPSSRFGPPETVLRARARFTTASPYGEHCPGPADVLGGPGSRAQVDIGREVLAQLTIPVALNFSAARRHSPWSVLSFRRLSLYPIRVFP
jgi:hypothetical protein